MGRTLFYTAPSSTSLISCLVGRDLSKLTDTILDLRGYFASPPERKDIIMDIFLRIHISRRWKSSSSAGRSCSCYIKRQISSSSTCTELGKTVKPGEAGAGGKHRRKSRVQTAVACRGILCFRHPRLLRLGAAQSPWLKVAVGPQ